MNKVKWGVIGAGGIADRRTLPGMMLAENAELAAVMEMSMELAEKLKVKYHANRAYDNTDDLLKDPEIQAVYIASPVFCHKEQAIKAAGAKKHILLEKPLALTSRDSEEILEACEKEGVKIASGFMMRFHPYHQKMREIVQSGKLGQIVSCRGQLTCWFPEMPGNWRQRKATSGGGAIMDMGVHCVDLIQYITGSKAKKVASFLGTKTFSYEVDDSSSTLLELENGAYAYVDANFNIPDAAARCRLEVYGTRGSLLAEGTMSQTEGGRLEAILASDSLNYDAKQNRADVAPVNITAEFGNMYTKEIEAFGRSVLYGTEVDVPGSDALQVQRGIEAALESGRSGKFILL